MNQHDFSKKFKLHMGKKKTFKQAERDVRGFVEVLKEVFKEGRPEDKLVFPTFGTFYIKHRKAKKTVHPKTKEPVMVPERNKVTLKCSPLLENLINNKVIETSEKAE